MQAAFVKQYVIPHVRVIRGKCHCQPELLTGSSGWNRSGKFLPGAENMTLCWPEWGSRATLPASLGFPIWSCAQIPGTCPHARTRGPEGSTGLMPRITQVFPNLQSPTLTNPCGPSRGALLLNGTSEHPGEAAEPVATVIRRQTEDFQSFTTPKLLVYKREASEFDGSGVL